MQVSLSTILPPLALVVGGGVLALLLTRAMIALGPKLGLMDQPDRRRVHVLPVPRAGGIAIWLAFLATAFLGRALYPEMMDGQLASLLEPFALSSLLLMALGVVDDRWGLKPLLKLAGQILAAALFFFLTYRESLVVFGYEIPPLIAACFFVGWAVLLINAFNLIDGLDGLCGGLVAFSLFVIACLGVVQGRFSDSLFVLIMLASVAGFLRYNINPARIFLGDAGSMMLGFCLATAATQTGGRRLVLGSILLPLAIVGVPLLDVLLAVWRRSARNALNRWQGKESVPIFGADKDHLHHRLLARGLSQSRVALLMQGMAIALAILVFLPRLLGTQGLAVTVAGFMVLGLFGIRHVAQIEFIQMGSVVHLALKRRRGEAGGRRWYFIYDVAMLFLASCLALVVETNLGSRGYDTGMGIRLVMAFTACQLVVLQVLRIYRRIWARASTGEFVLIALGLLVGGVVSALLFQVAAGDLAWSGARATFLATFLATWLILLPRAVPELLREFAVDSAHRRLTTRQNGKPQVLVFGAGDLGNLYVQNLMTSRQNYFQRYQVSGFLDSNPNLKNRTMQGFKIYGDLDMLPSIVERYPVHGLIVAIDQVSPERMAEIYEVALPLGLAVYSWTPDLNPLLMHRGAEK